MKRKKTRDSGRNTDIDREVKSGGELSTKDGDEGGGVNTDLVDSPRGLWSFLVEKQIFFTGSTRQRERRRFDRNYRMGCYTTNNNNNLNT